ncbi:MAG: YdcF family protein [Omnitrophica bacterium]|nr:YdcF family protein [Candidatus Omnitrophota bacterium]
MLKNEDIICISSIDWDFIWQGHQEIMTRLARGGNRVLFIENTGARIPGLKDFGRIKNRFLNWKKGVYGVRKIEKNLYVYSPLVLPFPYLRIARFINKKMLFPVLFRWLKTVGFKEPVVWAFLPTGLSLDLIEDLEAKVLIYYCIDSFQASSRHARKIVLTERLMIEKADLVFATSRKLFNYCAQYNKNVHYFPFAVSMKNFSRALDGRSDPPPDLLQVKKPIAGYVGGIHRWLDFDLIRHAAMRNSGVSFVFCGPIQTDVSGIKNLPNVYFLGQKKADELPGYVREFDVTLIPYRITEYTRNVYPTKLNEYLSLGKRVISVNLPEVIEFNNENSHIVEVTTTKEAFSDSIASIINQPPTEDKKAFAIEVAGKNSWTSRIENMSALIERVAYEKTIEKEISWKNNLSRLYKKTKKKFVPAILVAVLLYAIIFRSPLLWFLASPLYISDSPGKADVIMALGGGVGESGKVGQGYAERVETSVRLYNEDMAGKIIYSSGYRYILKEAQVMKALSVYMGVREDDITVDKGPINTYEMVMHLKEFMMENNWKSAILVSSPYHMRRLKLLCAKHLEGMNIYLVPVERSRFYSRGSRVKLRQITGIAHEYLAILHYTLKGYI